MKLISLFESLTNAKVKDCIVIDFLEKSNPKNDNFDVIFIIEESQAGKAIGKHGINVMHIERMIKKRIKIIEFNEDISKFIKNVLYPLVIREVKVNNKTLHLFADKSKLGILIGREGRNLEYLKSLAKRYFDIETIKVSS